MWCKFGGKTRSGVLGAQQQLVDPLAWPDTPFDAVCCQGTHLVADCAAALHSLGSPKRQVLCGQVTQTLQLQDNTQTTRPAHVRDVYMSSPV